MYRLRPLVHSTCDSFVSLGSTRLSLILRTQSIRDRLQYYRLLYRPSLLPGQVRMEVRARCQEYRLLEREALYQDVSLGRRFKLFRTYIKMGQKSPCPGKRLDFGREHMSIRTGCR